MWGNWVEKAKQAAAVIDQQLNESVGVEVPVSAKIPVLETATSGGGTSVAKNVWNDDDFNFDDDEATTPPSIEAISEPETTNIPPGESTVAKAKADEPEEENPDFDNFDGLHPSQASEQMPDGQITPPTHHTLVGGFPSVKLGALGDFGKRLVGDKIKTTAPDINFMSPLSSLMTSISNDQAPDDEKNQTQSSVVTRSNETLPIEIKETIFTPAEANGAWQEEDIDLDGDNDGKLVEQNMPTDSNKEESFKASPAEAEKASEPTAVKDETKHDEVTQEEAKQAPVDFKPVLEDYSQRKQSQEIEAPQQLAVAQTAQTAAVTSGFDLSGSVGSSVELEEVKKLLAQREAQLAAKAEQMFQLQQMYEKEKADLIKKVADTKEEAKKRIMKARERCEAAEANLQASTSALTESAAQQAEIVAALREEGQKLAMKQAEMEKSVRLARGEARELKEQLEDERTRKEDALQKIEKLQADLKSTQEQLASARRGETQAGKLEKELEVLKEDVANKANTIMALEQTVKELKAENKELTTEVEASRAGAALETQKQAKNLRKEHNAAIADLENKLQISEREAAVREDSLRHEVEELRKRWQDAVRRADALSMDVQSSTAPLLRQLESMERQHRARASAAAELETKLRAELEETVIHNEKLLKEHAEMKTKNNRFERQTKEQQASIVELQSTIEELTMKIARLEEKLQTMQIEKEKKQEEYERVERLANEGVSKVRSEMSQAVLDSEERYRAQLETMTEELRIERAKRTQLEQQVDGLLENAAVMIPNPSSEYTMKHEAKPAKLKQSEGQAQILENALLGLAGSGEDTDENISDDDEDEVAQPKLSHQTSTGSSYAALEQLTQNLKAAKKELETLRKRLAESEKTRESLLEDLADSREAKDKLPLFEAKVKELMADNHEKELEIRGLQEDIAEVKEMYRSQLNILVEEKAAAEAEKRAEVNGRAFEPEEAEEPVPELVEDVLGIA